MHRAPTGMVFVGSVTTRGRLQMSKNRERNATATLKPKETWRHIVGDNYPSGTVVNGLFQHMFYAPPVGLCLLGKHLMQDYIT